MFVCFTPPPERLRRFLVGPLGPHIESFASLIAQQGYGPAVGWRKVYLVAELSRWLERKHVALKDLEERHVAAFLHTRWRRVNTERLMGECNASPHTIANYRDAFRLLIAFAQKRLKKPPTWLGHESMGTTQIYLHADLKLKEQALAKTEPFKGRNGRYRPPEQLLAFLQSL